MGGGGGLVLGLAAVGARHAVPPQEIVLPQEAVPPRDLMKGIWANDHDSRTLADLRDTLLPKLVSGEVRVAEAERWVEEVGAE